MTSSSFRVKKPPEIPAAIPSHPEISDRGAVGAHPSSAISFTPSGLIVATDVQTALAELDTKKVGATALTVDGNLLTRAAGVPAEITRAALAADPAFQHVTGGVVLRDGPRPTTSGTPLDIPWATEDSDPDGWHAAASIDLVVPAGKAGRYIVTFSGVWSASMTVGSGSVFARIAGAAFQGNVVEPNGFHTLTFVHTLAVGDTLEFRVIQGTGAGVNVTTRLEICPV